MATLRKYNNKWQAQVFMKGVRKARSFKKKQLASQWANKVEAEIINGTYEDNNELGLYSYLLVLFFDNINCQTNLTSCF